MPSNIVGYEWSLQQTKHVLYATGEDHIHEMVGEQNGSWRDSDISELANAPDLRLETAVMTGSTWPAGRTQQVVYVSPVDGTGHVHELVMREGSQWSYEDIMAQPIGAVPADGRAISSFSWTSRGTKHIIYSGSDNHLHELSVGVVGMWNHVDLTQQTNAPEIEGDALAACVWEANNTAQVYYSSNDGHIHELMTNTSGGWSHTDITALTTAPTSAEERPLVAYAWEAGGTKQVVYMGDDGHIYELVFSKGGNVELQQP